MSREAAASLSADVARVLAGHAHVLVAPEDPGLVFRRLLEARYVTATVTEKGYCLTTDGELDLDHPDIRRDLDRREQPTSLIGWIAEGLSQRRRHDLPLRHLFAHGALRHRSRLPGDRRYAEAPLVGAPLASAHRRV